MHSAGDMLLRCSSSCCIRVRDFNRLGEDIFRDIPALEQAETGSGVRHLLKGTFRDCRNLKYVKFGGNVIKIDRDCFPGCSSLEIVEFEGDGTHPYFPETIKHMFITNYESSFRYCTNMKAFVVPDHQVSVWKNKPDNVFKAEANHSLATVSGDTGYKTPNPSRYHHRC